MLLGLLAAMPACKTTIIDDPIPSIESTDPMRFTIVRESEEQTAVTRASQPLTSGFMVSCYKHYGQPTQQTVMPMYEVLYHVSGDAWNGSTYSYWTYDDVMDQYLRYWDLSAFPYRFHAIAPYPANPDGFILGDVSLKINSPYYAQTCHNGMITPANNVAEPHLIAQVQRGTDGRDHDLLLLSTQDSELNNGNPGNKVRDVWLPFHHLNSKIRFGIFHTTQWLTANKTYIKNLVISVSSSQFATEATGYQATVSGLTDSWRILDDSNNGNAGFTDVTTVSPTTELPHPIFRYDGGPEIAENDLREWQTHQTAYFLQCPDGIMQIPQTDVRMTVSFDLMQEDGTLYQRFNNVPIRLEIPNGSDPPEYDYVYTFDWQSGYIYTYYLVLGEIEHKLEITFTATLTPWEDVTGSLSTDLEQ